MALAKNPFRNTAFSPFSLTYSHKSKLNVTLNQYTFHVHSILGPGPLESVYEKCLCHVLQKRGVAFRNQALLPIQFEGEHIEAGLQLDLLVEDSVIGELKAVIEMHPVYQAQMITYLKLSGRRLDFLINFNVPMLRDGIKRIVV